MDTKRYEGSTKGPWEVDSGMVQTVAEHSCKVPGCGVHIPIAYMDRTPGNGTLPCERDANARLIADAPALLAENARLREALRRIATYVPKGSSADIIAQAALAEGKGEGR